MSAYYELKIDDNQIYYGENYINLILMYIFTSRDRKYKYANISKLSIRTYKTDVEPILNCKYQSKVLIVKKRLDIMGFS